MSKFDMAVMAANLRSERAKRRASQEDVARAIGGSQGAVQKWEAGECVPGLEYVFAMADYYGVSIADLCGWRPAA